jgi:TonB-linked SusC/RagA family outer membrane protein
MKKLVNLFSLLLLMTGLIGFAQDTVSGVVSDADGMPLPGATVVVQGTSIGVTTDFDGNYAISASEGDVLVFSYVGYVSQSVEVGSSSTVNVSLESSTALEEVIVTGIGTQERQRSVASAVTVGGEVLENLTFISPDQALNGRVAGLRMANISGTPGTSSQIRIRGESSITGNNAPLFVVDGVPIQNGSYGTGGTPNIGLLSMINSNDIESITVLKDASSTSVYGNRGSNGVIVITTKKGTAGKVSYQVSSSYGWQNKAVEGRQALSGAQRLELAAEMMENDFGFSQDAALNWMLTNRRDYRDWDSRGRVDTDWAELVSNPDAPIQSYDISASGGDADQNFRVSLGYKDSEAVNMGSSFESISGSVNYTRKFGAATIQTSNLVTNGKQLGQLETTAYFGNPNLTKFFMPSTEAAYNPDGSYLVPHPASMHHTLYLLEENIYESDVTRALSNSSVTLDLPVDGLEFKSTFALDFVLNANHEYQNPIEGDGVGEGGLSEQAVTRRFTWSTINRLEYTKVLGDNDHFISVVLGQSFQKNKNHNIFSYGEAPATDQLFYVSSFPTNRDAGGSFSDWKVLSYLGVANYSFQDKYIFNFTWRNDGSSRFASGYRFGNFFSYGIAWNISNENFLADNSVVNNLKLRASWGEAGDQNIGLNQYQSLFGYTADYDSQGAVFPTAFGNAIISWEKSEKLDVALDFGLFNNRVTGSVGYYQRDTNDLLQGVPLSLTTGHSSQTQNVGDVRNSGFEVELDATVVKAGDFEFDIYGNVSTNENEVLRLAQTADGEDINLDGTWTATRVGRPIYEYYLRQFGGVRPENGNAYWYVGGDGVDSPVSFEETESYNAALQAFSGTRIPTTVGALGFRFKYKGFSVDSNFTYVGGHKIYEQWARYFMSPGQLPTLFYQGSTELMNRWQNPGDVTNIPRMRWSSSMTTTGSNHSTMHLHDGDFVRLRDLTVNYNFPSNMISEIGLDRLSVYVKGTNIWTYAFDDDVIFEPEVNVNNGQWTLWNPIPKIWALGVNLSF